MTIYVQNVATMLGLALAIDYSLFMVSRFREELRRGRTVAEAVETTVATSGKAVAFSGFAVAIGLSGLLLFKAAGPASRSGSAARSSSLSSVFFALTFLPAVLGMLGHRVNALSLRGLFDAAPARVRTPVRRPATSRWARRRPLGHGPPAPVLDPGPRLPAPRRDAVPAPRPGHPDASIYPAGLESRDAYVALADRVHAPARPSPIVVLATSRAIRRARPTPWRWRATRRAGRRVDGIDRVEGPFADRPGDRRAR